MSTPETPMGSTQSDPYLMPKIVYILYALGYFVGITSLVGLVLAYVMRGKNTIADSHHNFQIRTFWISLAIAIIGAVTMIIGIGFLILLFLMVWGLVRIISGFLLLNDGKPISDVKYLGLLAT